MTTPLSDERLAARTIAQFRHWVALSDSTEDAAEQRLLDAMLAASVPDLLDEVERLRARNAELEEQNARWQVMVDRIAGQSADYLLRAREAERRIAGLVAVLREVEWSGVRKEDGETICPTCLWLKDDGHAPDCALDAALRGADE